MELIRTNRRPFRQRGIAGKAGTILCFLLFWPAPLPAAEGYSFDLAEIEKKSCHVGGYLEAKPILSRLRTDAAFYLLKYRNRDLVGTLEEGDLKVQLEGSLEKDQARLYVKTNTDVAISRQGDREKTDLYEGFLSLKPSSSWKIDAGKKTFKWGKGYAWNPVAFIDRPKDPDDPEIGMEGFFALSADYTKSFAGPLKTLSFTPVVLPADARLNPEFGKKNHVNLAGKLYLLLFDTDIDLMALTGGSRSARFGVDVSRNITTNWEVHGEAAFLKDVPASILDRSGTVSTVERDAASLLLGTRYLTARDTTCILEYYRNGAGFTEDEMQAFFGFVRNAHRISAETGQDAALQKAASLLEGQYGRANPMRDYLYLRISQKEPFDILYFTPAVTTVLNLQDRSLTVSPEMAYAGITNLDLRLKASFIAGSRDSEYGEKPFDFKLELRAGYYF